MDKKLLALVLVLVACGVSLSGCKTGHMSLSAFRGFCYTGSSGRHGSCDTIEWCDQYASQLEGNGLDLGKFLNVC